VGFELVVLGLLVLGLLVLGLLVLGQRLADPAGLVVVVDGHDLATSASATRVRFIRPKL
jgi:hypothetical protein